MNTIPQVPMESERAAGGQVCLVDGTIIEVPVAYGDLVNGGIMIDAAQIRSVVRDGQPVDPESLCQTEFSQCRFWIPGHRIEKVLFTSGERRTGRAGFLP